MTVEEKISPLRELFVDAPEVRQGTLASPVCTCASARGIARQAGWPGILVG